MRQSYHRIPLLVAGLVAMCGSARGDEPPAQASMQCERASEPGRVKCSAQIRVANGKTLDWADALLVELPDFVTALKGRIGPADATAKEAGAETWAFGLVAKKTGEGTVKGRVRAVVCGAQRDRCVPIEIDVRATVHVGG